jgi:pimeloyl-ACP methyl ester carboxylesterase
VKLPETHYARSGDVNIAYQVAGEGALDVVWIPGFVSHLDLQWGDPRIAYFWERLASFARLILFDRRGMGLSDPLPGPSSLEERVDDVRAVMEAAGSHRAALVGFSIGGPLGMLFAATYPDRVVALVLPLPQIGDVGRLLLLVVVAGAGPSVQARSQSQRGRSEPRRAA